LTPCRAHAPRSRSHRHRSKSINQSIDRSIKWFNPTLGASTLRCQHSSLGAPNPNAPLHSAKCFNLTHCSIRRLLLLLLLLFFFFFFLCLMFGVLPRAQFENLEKQAPRLPCDGPQGMLMAKCAKLRACSHIVHQTLNPVTLF
jgi:hypothetical protein